MHLFSGSDGQVQIFRCACAAMPSIGSLDVLICELDKITQQQVTLRTAVHLNQAVVVHPRKEASLRSTAPTVSMHALHE